MLLKLTPVILHFPYCFRALRENPDWGRLHDKRLANHLGSAYPDENRNTLKQIARAQKHILIKKAPQQDTSVCEHTRFEEDEEECYGVADSEAITSPTLVLPVAQPASATTTPAVATTTHMTEPDTSQGTNLFEIMEISDSQ